MTMKSNVVEDGTEIITPPCELLDIPIGLENLECSVKGCGRVVSNSSALRLHLLKSHGIGEPPEDTQRKKLFACPVQGCPRNVESARKKFFKVMYLLKRHYQLVHAEKRHPCEKCGKKFGTSLATIKHEESCRRFFYCTCGVYYTTKNGLRVHLLKHDNTHKAVPDTNEIEQEQNEHKEQPKNVLNEEQMQTVTVPCFLYIPKDNATTFQNKQQQQQQPPTESLSQLQSNSRYIRILPKKKKTEKVNESIQVVEPNQLTKYCNTLASGGLLSSLPQMSDIGSQQKSSAEIQSENNKNQNLPKVYDTGAFASDKKHITVNPGKVCRTILPKTVSKLITDTQNLISNFTQTTNSIFPITQQVDSAIQTCGSNYSYSTVEVLETSDFSSQCQLNDLLQLPVDNQTQTDELDKWLAHFQNNTNSIDIETQTNLTTPSDNDIVLDKSVQLDDILSGKTWDAESSSIYICSNTDKHIPALFMSNKNMECKQTISTQTLNDIQFEVISSSSQRSKIDDKDIILPSEFCVDEPLSMSFGTQTGFEDTDIGVGCDLHSSTSQEMLSFGTQTGLESDFFSSSSTQTWDAEETSINAKNIETQTAISFSDLLDSSFIDEYLNTDRIMSTQTQTQTYQDDLENLENTKKFATIETQTR